MKNSSIVVLSVVLLGIGGCASVGKGKGKAPPPYASPIVTKG